MNRNKLKENLSRLNETDIDILTYLTEESIDWFNNPKRTDSEIERKLDSSFPDYADNHPMTKLYYKIIDGIYDGQFFNERLFSESLESLVKQANKLYADPATTNDFFIILRAIVERDFEGIVDYYDLDEKLTFDKFMKSVQTEYIDVLADWLEEDDLKTIIMFCAV